MSAVNIRLYDIFRKDLKLSDEKAQEFVQAIEDVHRESITVKHEHTMEIVHKDIQALKDHIDAKFATKDDLVNLRSEFKDMKGDLMKWMFIFWATQLIAMFTFLKFFINK